MPKRLMDCVSRVQQSGKSRSSAWAICQKSTGLKPHKKKKAYLDTLSLADHLDEIGLYEEATKLDEVLQKEAQWKWFKEKGQQLKDWSQTEREMDPQRRQVLTNIRQTHWNLINQINTAYQLLDNAGKNMHKPDIYVRDLGMAINTLQRDLGQALAVSQQAAQQASQFGMGPTPTMEQQLQGVQPGEQEMATPGVGQQVEKLKELKQQYPGAGRMEPSRPLSPEETPTEIIRVPQPPAQQIVPQGTPAVRPGQTFQPGQVGKTPQLTPTPQQPTPTPQPAQRQEPDWVREQREVHRRRQQGKVVHRLLKLADRFDEQGITKIADKLDGVLKQAQLGWAKEKGTQLGDVFRARMGVIDENIRQRHYDIMGRLKQLYNNLQALRQNITDPNYPAKFQKYIQAAGGEFQDLLQAAQEIQQSVGAPTTAPPVEEPQEEVVEPLAESQLDVNLQEMLKTLTPEQKQRVLQIIQQSQQARGQGV